MPEPLRDEMISKMQSQHGIEMYILRGVFYSQGTRIRCERAQSVFEYNNELTEIKVSDQSCDQASFPANYCARTANEYSYSLTVQVRVKYESGVTRGIFCVNARIVSELTIWNIYKFTFKLT